MCLEWRRRSSFLIIDDELNAIGIGYGAFCLGELLCDGRTVDGCCIASDIQIHQIGSGSCETA